MLLHSHFPFCFGFCICLEQLQNIQTLPENIWKIQQIDNENILVTFIIIENYKTESQTQMIQDDSIIEQVPFLSQIQVELLQMGFDSEQIKQALKLTQDKTQLVQKLIASREIKRLNQQAQDIAIDLGANKMTDKSQSKMENQYQENQSYQSVEEDYKMIFLARMDIKLTLGKMACQVATSALSAFKQIEARIDKDQMAEIAYYEWQQSGQKKIVVKVNSEAELLNLVDVVRKQKINVFVCKSTPSDQLQIPEGTITVAAIGPAPEDILDKLTGHLKLF